jgi:hypothetical protein
MASTKVIRQSGLNRNLNNGEDKELTKKQGSKNKSIITVGYAKTHGIN